MAFAFLALAFLVVWLASQVISSSHNSKHTNKQNKKRGQRTTYSASSRNCCWSRILSFVSALLNSFLFFFQLSNSSHFLFFVFLFFYSFFFFFGRLSFVF